MEPALFQDSLWFLAAVLWLLAGLLVRWPGKQESRERVAKWSWLALCAAQALAAGIHLLSFDLGAPATLVRADWFAGALVLAALVIAIRPATLRVWITQGPQRRGFIALIALQVLLWPAVALAFGGLRPLLITDFLPWGFARSGLALALGAFALRAAWQAQTAPLHRRDLAPRWLVLVLLVGVVLAEWLATQSRERSAEAVVVRAQSLSLALDADALASLAIDERTHESAAFRTLRAQLLRLRRANPDAAYLYLATLHAEHVIYPVSGAEFYYSDKAGAPLKRIPEQDVPFEKGPAATAFYRQLFSDSPEDRWEFTREPSFYGVLLSAYSKPITLPDGRTSPYVLGLDVRSQTFLLGARHARRLAQALTLAGIAAVLLFLRYQIDTETAEADRLARAAADQRERTRNEFLGMISHELRTPVHAILARTGALRQGSPVEETAVELDSLAGDLQRLVEDLLQASALQGPSFRLQARRCRLPGVLHEIARTAERDATVKGLAFITTLSPALPAVITTDELRLRQILVNLLSNAVKYTMSGEICFAAEVIDSTSSNAGQRLVRFTVSDTGPGLAPNAQARIFEPFFRANETAWQPGMGLGLAVARDLCARLGGTLHFKPGHPRGAIFNVNLPFTVESSASIAPMPVANLRVALIVEDHPSLRLHLAEQIEKLGWTALTADTIAAANTLWQEAPLSVVFLDQQLPDGTGAAWLTQRLAQRGPRPWVIGMSASLDPEIAEALLAAGANDFLFKPVSQTALREALELRSVPFNGESATGLSLSEVDAALSANDWAAAARAAHFLINQIIAVQGPSPLLTAARKLEIAVRAQAPLEINTARADYLAALSAPN
ncbi:ATP-binding protein [Oleiharenicola lentus]|uniref:ATP-binding protein n=1 Tax=Oleiharenicola lentus TaxID=2508720 RepID=UPI003F667525